MQKPRVVRHEVVQPQDQSIRLIPLTQGQNAIVDASDYDWLMEWNWRAVWNVTGKRFYACRHDAKRWTVFMHQHVLGVETPVDHINRDGLDNRRENLRPCDYSTNGANRPKESINTSGYKGVFRNGKTGWMARIKANDKAIYIGTFGDRESAARAYDAAAIRYFGEFAHLNFPSES